MAERILVVGDRSEDIAVIRGILSAKGFFVDTISHESTTDDIILSDRFAAIVADFDRFGQKAGHWMELLQKGKSRVCLIGYGEEIGSEETSELLQKGTFGYIPRGGIPKRIRDTLAGGLENRRAFVNILEMIDQLRDTNQKLEDEKSALNEKNRELAFINRLSREVAYDLNWDRILPRIMQAGLCDIVDAEFVSILYRIGSSWKIAVGTSAEQMDARTRKKIKEKLIARYAALAGEKISGSDTGIEFFPTQTAGNASMPLPLSDRWLHLLRPLGKTLGMLAVVPKSDASGDHYRQEFMSTVSNILSMSLNNAREYHRLKELSDKDPLTCVLNHKGFKEVVNREFQQAKRYHKQLSVVMIDLDDFKRINDTYGHLAGDFILQEFAGCLKRALRQSDIVARCGGDEFVIILPETDRKQARQLMQRVRFFITNRTFNHKTDKITICFSYGISTMEEFIHMETAEALVAVADSKLYDTKRSQGRMRSTG